VKGRPDLNGTTKIVFLLQRRREPINKCDSGGEWMDGFGARAYGDWGMAVGAAG
jgi:hypothetical protein